MLCLHIVFLIQCPWVVTSRKLECPARCHRELKTQVRGCSRPIKGVGLHSDLLRRCIDCKSEKKEDCKCQIAFHQQMFFHSAETKVEMRISGRKSCITVFSKTQKIFQWTQKFTLTQNPAGLKRRFFRTTRAKTYYICIPKARN